MLIAVLVTQVLIVALAAYFVARQSRSRAVQEAPPPRAEPVDTASMARAVRRTEYDADLAALTRRLTDLEAVVDQRHQQVMGAIGNIHKAEKRAKPDPVETARELFDAAKSNAAAAPAAEALPGRRVVVLPASARRA